MITSIPPVGSRVLAFKSRATAPSFPGFDCTWLNCGTAALALALLAAKALKPEVKKPKVILPAYGCPDLVAAAVFAGVKPVLVDIQPDDPSYDLDKLSMSLDEAVIAVVAVNFLGIRERLQEIKDRLVGREIALIEDNAQWFPEEYLFEIERSPADFILTSFGRGKPVNLLGGGLLLSKTIFTAQLKVMQAEYSLSAPKKCNAVVALGFRLKSILFNAFLTPTGYGILSRLPFLDIGATKYHSLSAITSMDEVRRRFLPLNLRQRIEQDRSIEAYYHNVLDEGGVHSLPVSLSERCGRLLRYPVLVDTELTRKYLIESKLGASPFYGKPLITIDGISALAIGEPNPTGARKFSERLLTFPVHSAVHQKHVDGLTKIIQRS